MDDLAEIEKEPGPPDVKPVSIHEVDSWRQKVYVAYETFLRDRLGALDQNRDSGWHRDYSSGDAYRQSVQPMRERLARMLGFWVDHRHRAALKVANRQVLIRNDSFTATRFSLEILPGLETYGIELSPEHSDPRSGLLLQHGYGGSPEAICGLTESANANDYSYRSLGLRAVRRGFHVVAIFHPSGYGEAVDVIGSLPAFPQRGYCYGKNRLHRLATLADGTLFGLDMMACSRGIDLLASLPHVLADQIGMYGLSQGGQSALFLPALDERIQASVCSAYFNMRLRKLVGPHRALSYLDSAEEDKFFTDVVAGFSDADLVSLIAPRAFAVEAGLRDTSVDFEKSSEEFTRAKAHYQKLGLEHRAEYIAHSEGHVSATRQALDFLVEQLALAGEGTSAQRCKT